MSEKKPVARGRPPNMPEADAVRDTARAMTLMLMRSLAQIVETGKNEAARVSAARELLDRGWGRAHIIPSGELRPQSKIEITFPTEDEK